LTIPRIARRWFLLLAAASWANPAGSQVDPMSSLIVDPRGGILASGPPGGPFTPSSFQYRIRSSTSPVKYSINTPSWLAADPAVGTADLNGVTITLTINPTASGLAPGRYGPAIAFKNVTNGRGTTVRTSMLVVERSGLPQHPATPSASAPPAAILPTPSQHRIKPSIPRPHSSASPSGMSGGYLLDEQGGYLLDRGGQRMPAC